MARRIVSNSEQSVLAATNLPFETTDLNAQQIAQVSGGYIGCDWYDIIADYISEEFGIDLPEPVLDVPPWSI